MMPIFHYCNVLFYKCVPTEYFFSSRNHVYAFHLFFSQLCACIVSLYAFTGSIHGYMHMCSIYKYCKFIARVSMYSNCEYMHMCNIYILYIWTSLTLKVESVCEH